MSQELTQNGGGMTQYAGETASAAAAAQAKALVEARFVIAYRNPRDLDTVREKMLKECRRPSFAKVARYLKPIGKGIAGPSIRFAEMALRCMSNVSIDTPTTFDDREKRVMRVTATDLEANVTFSADITIEKTIERRNPKAGDVVIRTRTNSKGEPVSIIEATEDDILNKQNALVSKAVRTLGLRLVPGDMVDECQDVILQTMANEDARDPDAAKRTVFDAFAALGIGAAELKEYLGHEGKVLSPAELAELRGLYSAIRDGEANWPAALENKIARKVPDYTVKSKSEAKAKPAANAEAKPEFVTVGDLTVDVATGLIVELDEPPTPQAEKINTPATTAQEAQQATPASTPSDATSKPADAQPANAQEAERAGGDFGTDLTTGAVRQVRNKAARAGKTVQDVVDAIGGQINAGSINQALAWLEKQPAVQS